MEFEHSVSEYNKLSIYKQKKSLVKGENLRKFIIRR